jgi:hypothetical protein
MDRRSLAFGPEDEPCLMVMALWDDEPVEEDEQWSTACAWLADEPKTSPSDGRRHSNAGDA